MGQFDGLSKTTNLKLNKPSYDNVADIEALNENADILDTEISKIKGKYVSSVNGKTGDVTIEKYTHPNSGVNAGTYRKVTVNAQGHVTAGVDGAVPITEGGTGATNANQARTNLGIDNLDMTPVGDVVFRPFLKAGYVKANGATVNRADYPRLVAFANANNLWTDSPSTEPWKYGRGNGSTTMVLPNYIGRFIQGGDMPAVLEAGLPEIEGVFYDLVAHKLTAENGKMGSAKGAFKTHAISGNGVLYSPDQTNIEGSDGISFNASSSNSIYDNSTTVQPPSIVLIPQLRY